jgi:hypothetical protein
LNFNVALYRHSASQESTCVTKINVVYRRFKRNNTSNNRTARQESLSSISVLEKCNSDYCDRRKIQVYLGFRYHKIRVQSSSLFTRKLNQNNKIGYTSRSSPRSSPRWNSKRMCLRIKHPPLLLPRTRHLPLLLLFSQSAPSRSGSKELTSACIRYAYFSTSAKKKLSWLSPFGPPSGKFTLLISVNPVGVLHVLFIA